MAFHIGQKVVCVDDSNMLPLYGEEIPVKGVVYTVRGIHRDGNAIYLMEIRNEPRQYLDRYAECSFWGRRFRPIVEQKTDIRIFRKMLTPEHEPAK